ncbi:MAG: hypothetical protein WBC63_03905 [Candidatus Bipolaricaulia bacterium]
MNWESVWNVLKWVLVVLVAGFIGQFGKSFALRLIEQRRKERRQTKASAAPQVSPDIQLEEDRLEALAKIDKKRTKAEVKRIKKTEKPEVETED